MQNSLFRILILALPDARFSHLADRDVSRTDVATSILILQWVEFRTLRPALHFSPFSIGCGNLHACCGPSCRCLSSCCWRSVRPMCAYASHLDCDIGRSPRNPHLSLNIDGISPLFLFLFRALAFLVPPPFLSLLPFFAIRAISPLSFLTPITSSSSESFSCGNRNPYRLREIRHFLGRALVSSPIWIWGSNLLETSPGNLACDLA